jgi:hypothetical protein
MNGSTVDQQLLQLVSGAPPATIQKAIASMGSIDGVLASDDGLKWFNLLYLKVTKQILANPPASGWQAPVWLTRLDVVFASMYFSTIAGFLAGRNAAPSSWQALLEARRMGGIDRIQFALAGMNAHINHDLALALLQTNAELQLAPGLAQDTGKIGRLLAFWNIHVARDLAWDFSDHLRTLPSFARQVALTTQDRLTGALGRSLLLQA